MMKYNVKQKQAGELAIKSLSSKAQNYYFSTDPLRVYEYYDGATDTTRYAYDYGKGSGIIKEGLTLAELEKEFESLSQEDAPGVYIMTYNTEISEGDQIAIDAESEAEAEEKIEAYFRNTPGFRVTDVEAIEAEAKIRVWWKDGKEDSYTIEADYLADEVAEIRASNELMHATVNDVNIYLPDEGAVAGRLIDLEDAAYTMYGVTSRPAGVKYGSMVLDIAKAIITEPGLVEAISQDDLAELTEANYHTARQAAEIAIELYKRW